MSTMKAVRVRSFGKADVLRIEETPRPIPGRREVLVRIHAAGVNPVDWKTRAGAGAAGMVKRPFPLVLGWDFAGTVAALGEGVTELAEGDAVYGMVRIPDEGTYAEYVRVPVEHVARKPETLTFEEAAAVPLAALTAWQALFGAAQLKAREKVLIHAAAGGVGHLAVQLAKAHGAYVVATASASNHDFVRALGADEVIDYTRERFEDRVADADVVFDTMGGDTQARSFYALRRGGTLVSILSTPNADKARELRVHATWIFVQPSGAELMEIAKRIDGGKLKPVVSDIFPIREVEEAHRRGERGHTRGKVVLRVTGAWAVLAALAGSGPLGCSQTPAPPATFSSKPAAVQVASFDAKKSNLPEGLAVRGNKAYVGFAPTSEIIEVDVQTKEIRPFSTLPQPIAGKGFMTGLAFNGADLYAALVSFVPDVQAGIYRAEPGARAKLFAKHAEMAFPNGLAVDAAGRMFVTDSAAGAIFRISRAGEVSKWAGGPLLSGSKDFCGPGRGVGVPFDIGANGIAIKDGAVYVTNTDKAPIVRVPVTADGAAGEPQAFAGPSCENLGGADGLALDPRGNFVAADNHLNKIVRIDTAGNIVPVVQGAPLDFPASVVFRGSTLFATNFSFLDAATDHARPGLMRVDGY
jgi:NADPH:quinone reductase-like Zn-dependent oxidoreductase